MKRLPWTREKAMQRYENGFGQGIGSDYKPWIGVKDLPSLGTSHRVPGRKNGRMHELFSDGELRVFLACQHMRGVVDIREQFPLWPLAETEAIASTLGFRHPGPIGADPQVMTTDLLLTMQDGTWIAISVKPSSKLKDTGKLRNLEIERRYWLARSISWWMVTELEISCILANNLRLIAGHYDIPSGTMDAATIDRIEAALLQCLLTAPAAMLGSHCREVDASFGLKAGSSLSVVKHALARRRWETKLDIPIDSRRPLSLTVPIPVTS